MGHWSIPLLLPRRPSSQEQHIVSGGERGNELDRHYQLLPLSATTYHISVHCDFDASAVVWSRILGCLSRFCFPFLFQRASSVFRCFCQSTLGIGMNWFGLEKQVLSVILLIDCFGFGSSWRRESFTV
jgi:hypothetical protein